MAAPLADREAIAYLERRFFRRRALRRQLLRRPGRVLARQAAVRRIVRRRAALGGPSAERPGAGLPAYVRAIAAEAGADVEHTRWALAAPGDYPSQKVLFFLFGSTGEVPDAIVKITRDPELNYRLENEWRALTILRELGVGTDDTLPRPLFLGSHSGLAVLGESAIDGAPFRERTRATADCVHARAAVEWLRARDGNRLAAGCRRPRPFSELDALLAQFKRLYRLEAKHEDLLDAHASALMRSAERFPLVFQHGDPGPWNVLITSDGRLP